MRSISQDLRNTVINNPHIEDVYFDAIGRHYLNVFELQTGEKDKKPAKQYGRGIYSHRELIPGEFNVDKIHDTIAKGVPDTLIVDTISRQDIIENCQIIKEGKDLSSLVSQATDDEKAELMAALGLDPTVIALMKKMAIQGASPVETVTPVASVPPVVKK